MSHHEPSAPRLAPVPGLGGARPSCTPGRCASRALCGLALRRLRAPVTFVSTSMPVSVAGAAVAVAPSAAAVEALAPVSMSTAGGAVAARGAVSAGVAAPGAESIATSAARKKTLMPDDTK